MNRKAIERAIYAATHRDYRTGAKPGQSTGSILRLLPGQGTCLVPLSSMTDDDLLACARDKRVDLRQPKFKVALKTPAGDIICAAHEDMASVSFRQNELPLACGLCGQVIQ